MQLGKQRDGPELRVVRRDAEPQASSRDAGPTADRLDWSALMARAQAGDRETYRRLLEAVTPYLRSLAARRTSDAAEVEDLVQDILMTVHAVRHTYDPQRPFGPWLATIAERRIIDGLRRRGRRQAHELPLEPEHETLSSPAANLQQEASDARALHEAIARLPAGQRDAVRMLKLQEMSLRDASAASGQSVAALKVAMHRALTKLRALLGPTEDNL